MPNVEDRLPLLIQKQLNALIHKQPPLFPWETKIEDYDTTEVEFGNSRLTSPPTSSPTSNLDAPADR